MALAFTASPQLLICHPYPTICVASPHSQDIAQVGFFFLLHSLVGMWLGVKRVVNCHSSATHKATWLEGGLGCLSTLVEGGLGCLSEGGLGCLSALVEGGLGVSVL